MCVVVYVVPSGSSIGETASPSFLLAITKEFLQTSEKEKEKMSNEGAVVGSSYTVNDRTF